MTVTNKVAVTAALVIVMLSVEGCYRPYLVFPHEIVPESHEPKGNNKMFKYEDSLLILKAKADYYWLEHSILNLGLCDRSNMGLFIDSATVVKLDKGLDFNLSERFCYVGKIKEQEEIFHNSYNGKCDIYTYVIGGGWEYNNDFYASSYHLWFDDDRVQFKFIFSVCYPNSEIYKTFELYFTRPGYDRKPVFEGYEPGESYFDFDFVVDWDTSSDAVAVSDQPLYKISLDVKNDKKWKIPGLDGHLILNVDSLSITYLNLHDTLYPKLSSVNRVRNHTEFVFGGIEINPKEDMIRVDFTVYLENPKTNIRSNVQRFTRPILLIPQFQAADKGLFTGRD